MKIQDIPAELAAAFEDEVSDIGLNSPIEQLMAAAILYVFKSPHHLGGYSEPRHELNHILPWEKFFGTFNGITNVQVLV